MPKRTNSQNGRRSRKKGHDWERFCAARFRTMGFPNAKRQLEYQEDECRGIDLAGTGNYLVQCKAYANYAPIGKINEIMLTPGCIPILITKGDHLEPMAVLPLYALEQLIRYRETGSELAVTPATLDTDARS